MRATWMMVLALTLPGCQELDFKNSIKFPDTNLRKSLEADRNAERELIQSFQTEDRILRYLSGDDYSCADPNAPQIRKYAKGDPAKIVADEDKEFAVIANATISIFNEYKETLQRFQTDHEDGKRSIDAMVNVLHSAASALSIPAFSGLSKTLKNAVTQLNNEATREQINTYAAGMQKTLEETADTLNGQLKKGPLLDRNRALNLWSTCARERLIFMRDAPRGQVGNGRYKALGTQSSVAELSLAYAAYIEKKNKYSSSLAISDTLLSIVKANAALVVSTSKVDAASVIGGISNFIDLTVEARKFESSN